MPTREEQVAQVEAALKQRFFPLVPKVVTQERTNWTEEQHDTDCACQATVGPVEKC